MESLNIVSFDSDAASVTSLWYFSTDHMVRYSVVVTATISCKMNFQRFPYDSHKCIFILKSWLGDTGEVVLTTPKILTNDEDGNEIGGEELNMTNDGTLEYNFILKPLPATFFVDNSHSFSKVMVEMRFERTRKSRGKLLSYHVISAVFSLLSLISYSIKIDIVPGRMGMLVLLYLIQINTYNSIEAPPSRGFSLIETWFQGTI